MTENKQQSEQYEGKQEEKRLQETGGWPEGVQPGIGRGAELDEALKEANPGADPAMRSAVPGFVAEPDPTEVFVEGPGVAEARNAREDLPRQG
ncbi:MAG TPA: hypothetical protein VIL69_10915 [Roseomonas sp.]|jgi:hypothetical protein